LCNVRLLDGFAAVWMKVREKGLRKAGGEELKRGHRAGRMPEYGRPRLQKFLRGIALGRSCRVTMATVDLQRCHWLLEPSLDKIPIDMFPKLYQLSYTQHKDIGIIALGELVNKLIDGSTAPDESRSPFLHRT
jgi:hypothetical protein